MAAKGSLVAAAAGATAITGAAGYGGYKYLQFSKRLMHKIARFPQEDDKASPEEVSKAFLLILRDAAETYPGATKVVRDRLEQQLVPGQQVTWLRKFLASSLEQKSTKDLYAAVEVVEEANPGLLREILYSMVPSDLDADLRAGEQAKPKRPPVAKPTAASTKTTIAELLEGVPTCQDASVFVAGLLKYAAAHDTVLASAIGGILGKILGEKDVNQIVASGGTHSAEGLIQSLDALSCCSEEDGDDVCQSGLHLLVFYQAGKELSEKSVHEADQRFKKRFQETLRNKRHHEALSTPGWKPSDHAHFTELINQFVMLVDRANPHLLRDVFTLVLETLPAGDVQQERSHLKYTMETALARGSPFVKVLLEASMVTGESIASSLAHTLLTRIPEITKASSETPSSAKNSPGLPDCKRMAWQKFLEDKISDETNCDIPLFEFLAQVTEVYPLGAAIKTHLLAKLPWYQQGVINLYPDHGKGIVEVLRKIPLAGRFWRSIIAQALTGAFGAPKYTDNNWLATWDREHVQTID